MKATQHEFFRPTPKTSLLGVLMIVVPYVSLTYFIKKERVSVNLNIFIIICFNKIFKQSIFPIRIAEKI